MQVTERWRFYLVDLDGNTLRELTTIEDGGRLTLNQNATIRGGGQITYRDDPDHAAPQWGRSRVRVEFTSDGQTWPMGVYVPVVNDTTYRDDAGLTPIDLLDNTTLLDQSGPDGYYTALTGIPVTTLIREALDAAGITRMAVTPTDAKLGAPLTWDANTTWLRVANDLADAANYFAVSADREGQLRVTPYEPPAARGVQARMVEGVDAWFTSTWTHTHNYGSVPNRVVCVSEPPERANYDADPLPPLVAVAENDDPESPYSFASTGVWRRRTYTGLEVTSQAALQALADQYLAEVSVPGETFTIQCRHLPLWLGDVVQFSTVALGDRLATVEKLDFTMTPGKLVSCVLRGVGGDGS